MTCSLLILYDAIFRISAILSSVGVLGANQSVKLPDYKTDSINFVENRPSPRFIKTHLPFELLPEKLSRSEETKVTR